MTEENRDAASRVSFDGAQFNAPTIFQFGNNSTAKIGETDALSLVKVERVLKQLKQGWPYLTSAVASAGGVWGVCALCADWVLPTLLWGTSTATTCFVIHGRQTRRQAKEREAAKRAAKESSFDVAQLSDAAIELLVYAALSQEKELRLQDNEIRFGLKPKTPAFYFDFPEQAPANSDVLAELVDCGALTQSRYKYVLNQEFVDKHLDAALEIDAQRIAHSLPEPGRQILNAARQEGDAVCCEHYSASSQAGIYANSSGAVYLGSAPALDVCRVLLMFQKNGLVNQWFLKEGPQSVPLFAPDDLPSHLKFNENAPTHGTITFIGGAPDRWKPYPHQSPNIGWNWAEGRLTKRGEEIAALLSPPAEPSV